MKIKERFYQFLNLVSKYAKTDMVYVLKGSFWWIFGRAFSFLASFLVLVFFARYASKEVYGAYQYVISMAAMIGIFSLSGIDTALISAIAREKEKTFFLCEKEKLKWGAISTLLSVFVAFWYFWKKNLELGVSFLISGLFLPFLAVFSLYLSFWQGKKKFDLQNKYFVLHNFLAALFLILIIILKPKVGWVVFGYYFAFTFATFLFWLKTRKIINKESKEERETISFGKHLTIMSLPSTISGQIDNVILWQTAGPLPVAIYAYALRLIERVSEFIPFSALALPKMANANFNHNGTKKRIFDKFLKLFWLAIPFTIIYILICPIFFKLFFPAYRESIIYSQALALTLIFSPFWFLGTAFLAQMKKKELYILSFIPQIVKILLFFILIPFFKIWGGVFSILISQLFQSVLTLYLFKKS